MFLRFIGFRALLCSLTLIILILKKRIPGLESLCDLPRIAQLGMAEFDIHLSDSSLVSFPAYWQ